MAFAGGFEELDENFEYEKREDEFDLSFRKPQELIIVLFERQLYN